MILYRPVGLQEVELIYDNGMKSFPASLPQQPIFYPVLQLEYARKIASDWNAKNGQFAGYVTQFKVEDEYLSKFEEHTVGESQHQEFWIPAAELDAFNQHIVGRIKVVEAHFGDAFQGFIPENFGLKGKNAAEQFTLLANSYIYKRMDFYLEIRRNHKAVFLNYPFWLKHDFKNQGLKEKILQAIKEAWFTSHPEIPLPSPVNADVTPEERTDPHTLEEPAPEDIAPLKQRNIRPITNPIPKEALPERRNEPRPLEDPTDEDNLPVREPDPQTTANPVHQQSLSVQQTNIHFLKGIELGLSGQYQEAMDELFQAVRETPDHVVAHTSLGVVFHRLGDDDRALSAYEAALKVDPIYAEAHYFRASILYSLGKVREAIAGYTIAIGLRPELIDAHLHPAPQDRLTNYTHSAAEMPWIAKPAHRILEINKALETHPGQAGLFKERAAEYYRLKNYVQAIADYGASLELQPDDASALHLQGLAYEQIGQLNRAQKNYRQASEIDPQLANNYINRGVTFGKMGQFRQAIVSFTEAIRLAPENPNGYFNRGMTYFQQGDLTNATEDFSKVIQLFPLDEVAYYWRGVSNEEAGRQPEATADYKKFLELSKDVDIREEIEQRLSQLDAGKRGGVSSRTTGPEPRQETNRISTQASDRNLDIYDLLFVLGERARHSTWLVSGVDSYGEKAEELSALADHNESIDGSDLLRITSAIHQTLAGDFQAFERGEPSPWIFIRAWKGSGFYIETNDPKVTKQLMTEFQAVEEVEGASPPYESLFIPI